MRQIKNRLNLNIVLSMKFLLIRLKSVFRCMIVSLPVWRTNPKIQSTRFSMVPARIMFRKVNFSPDGSTLSRKIPSMSRALQVWQKYSTLQFSCFLYSSNLPFTRELGSSNVTRRASLGYDELRPSILWEFISKFRSGASKMRISAGTYSSFNIQRMSPTWRRNWEDLLQKN